MTQLRTVSALFSFLLPFVFLSACQKTNADETTISNAQTCLDQASSSSAADSCVAQLGSLRSAEAYEIICSAHFIAQGFTVPRFVAVYNALKTSGGTTNPTAAALGVMSFNSTSGNDGSQQTLTDCQASNVASLEQLAVLAQMATLIGTTINPASVPYNSSSGYTPAQISTAITNYVSNGGSVASLGSTAITASQVYCAAGSTYATTSICTTLTAAIASSTDPATIGNELITQLQVANP